MTFGTCQVARAGQELHFFSPLPPPPGPQATLLPALGTMESPAGWRLTARSLPAPREGATAASPAVAWLDQDQVSFPLSLRSVLPGDRFWPAGARGAKKMQDFLVDAKIPRWLRPHLPVVISGEVIIWVPGLRLAEPVKLTPATSRVLEIEVSPTTATTARVWEMLLAWTRQSATPLA